MRWTAERVDPLKNGASGCVHVFASYLGVPLGGAARGGGGYWIVEIQGPNNVLPPRAMKQSQQQERGCTIGGLWEGGGVDTTFVFFYLFLTRDRSSTKCPLRVHIAGHGSVTGPALVMGLV